MGEVFGVGELPQGAGQRLLDSGYRCSLVGCQLELGDGSAAGRLHDEGVLSCGSDKDARGGVGVRDRSEDVARVDGMRARDERSCRVVGPSGARLALCEVTLSLSSTSVIQGAARKSPLGVWFVVTCARWVWCSGPAWRGRRRLAPRAPGVCSPASTRPSGRGRSGCSPCRCRSRRGAARRGRWAAEAGGSPV